jgi:hypothetical protein
MTTKTRTEQIAQDIVDLLPGYQADAGEVIDELIKAFTLQEELTPLEVRAVNEALTVLGF